ncbi:hypothetical protein C7Y72_04085 [Paraconexibacter algicola]|uniref:Uncharacterized protein n=1 Tax=Paraconexibacter algicola TaxID=2133960 RepID=A0A2T4UI47_9ACTN|nr:hypothetical protein C7Y72_04085 [Paraconexibacter algicola]
MFAGERQEQVALDGCLEVACAEFLAVSSARELVDHRIADADVEPWVVSLPAGEQHVAYDPATVLQAEVAEGAGGVHPAQQLRSEGALERAGPPVGRLSP